MTIKRIFVPCGDRLTWAQSPIARTIFAQHYSSVFGHGLWRVESNVNSFFLLLKFAHHIKNKSAITASFAAVMLGGALLALPATAQDKGAASGATESKNVVLTGEMQVLDPDNKVVAAALATRT